MRIAGFTSTGSKRPAVLWGGEGAGLPLRMTRSAGCRVWDEQGREYLDWIMGLGAVALGYGHPEVTTAATEAIGAGVIGPLPPVLEDEVADLLARHLPVMERIRFLKTGAEGMAAAVRLARVATGRSRVIGCGYHGWLDWASDTDGVPDAVRALFTTIRFNDVERGREAIRRAGDGLACVVIEPVIEAAPSPEWLRMLREETQSLGALLVFDEIKTAFRLDMGGATARYQVTPDLLVVGKALGNGFPLAALGGRPDIMELVDRTWISSTLATETVSLAAAKTVLGVLADENVPAHLGRVGGQLWEGLRRLAETYPDAIAAVKGLPEMCVLDWRTEDAGKRVVAECARRGVLWKRSAYNFVSFAHGDADVERTLDALDASLRSLG